MAFLIEKEDSDGIVRLIFSGHTGLRDVVMATERIMEDGRIVATRRLFDFRKADVHFSAEDVARISERSISKEPGNSRIALLVRGDVQYGLSAMFGGKMPPKALIDRVIPAPVHRCCCQDGQCHL